MANELELRQLVVDVLNTYCIDPFPSTLTRRGNQFFADTDGINLNRKDTFPKGYVTVLDSNAPLIENFGRVGHSTNFVTIGIRYFVKEKSKYTYNGVEYKSEDIVILMLREIQRTLLQNRIPCYGMSPTAFGTPDQPNLDDTGAFPLYEGVLPVTFYFAEEY